LFGQHPLDDHPAIGEPDLGPIQEPHRGLASFVRVDLGIGQPGVIIHRRVDEPMPDQPVAIAAAVAAGAVGLAVTATNGAAQEPVTTSSRDVAELLDVDVD
jgi:hypothetical protein